MKIAAYIDGQDQLVSLYQPGQFCIYEGSGADWTMVQTTAFTLDESLSLAAIKTALASAVAKFDGCEVLLSGGIKGFPYAYLQEEFGFRIWKSEGPLAEQLAGVEQHERERAEQQRSSSACAVAAGCASGACGGGRSRRVAAAPAGIAVESTAMAAEDLGGGHLRIDLVAAMRAAAKLNSRQVLLPILEGAAFERLDIICDHLPRWFEAKLGEMNLKVDVVPLEAGQGIKAIVSSGVRCG
ncbi:Fe-only nitrogenase accessory protein AnfO [Rhodopseudomonas sp. NSM]|uniref:Fe-only nitrogenase accessory protein AnfO n=1 Tax=Rhodopseudomonas sp. NSM TaxID=3457630 RepID=UPI0040369401